MKAPYKDLVAMKSCAVCKHKRVGRNMGNSDFLCYRNNKKQSPKYDIVTGELIDGDGNSSVYKCRTERGLFSFLGGVCGRQGKFFEAAPEEIDFAT